MFKDHLKILIIQLLTTIPFVAILTMLYDFMLARSIIVGGFVYLVVFLFYYLSTIKDFDKIDTTRFINRTKIAVAAKFVLTISLLVFIHRHYDFNLLVIAITYVLLYIENQLFCCFLYSKKSFVGK